MFQNSNKKKKKTGSKRKVVPAKYAPIRISWTAKKPNETVLREADSTSSLINRIREDHTPFFGRVMIKIN